MSVVIMRREHNGRRETDYVCKKRDVGLCIDPCFELYHTLLDCHFTKLLDVLGNKVESRCEIFSICSNNSIQDMNK